MAASMYLLPTPELEHQPWRSRKPFPSATLIMFSCFLFTLIVFFLAPSTITFTRSSQSVHLSFPSLHDTEPAPPPPQRAINTTSGLPNLRSCDLFNGSWMVDRGGPLYPPGSCPYVDVATNCFNNGRSDSNYLYYRWKPYGCDIPRFDGRRMMSMLRSKRVVFVGDSLNWNMWQSLICSLRHALPDSITIERVFTPKKSKLFGSFNFKDYNCSIDYVSAPFLAQRWRIKGERRETLRLDIIQDTASYHSADIIVFNTGHWWNFKKARNGIAFFQEGGHVHDKMEVEEGFKRALRTWARWVDALVDTSRSHVFFAGYSASHFRGGEWNSGGVCDGETEPITEESKLSPYPWMMREVESVISKMKTRVTYLNITRMTDNRKDAHPSMYRYPETGSTPRASGGVAGGAVVVQDCIHWCLPGVPDTWNQLFYAHLLNMLPQNSATI